MKITFFVHCFFPDHFYGTETYTLELAKYYQAEGHQVTVVSALFQGEYSKGKLLNHYNFQGIPVVCIDKNFLPHTRVKETYYQPEMRDILLNLLRDLSPDVVHVTHLMNHTAALLEVTQALSIPTYATFTDFFGFCLNNKLETAGGSLCRGPSISRANCIACHLKAAAYNPGTEKWISYASNSLRAHVIAETVNAVRRLPGIRNGPIDGLITDIVLRPDTLSALYNSGYRAAVAPTIFLRSAYEANNIKIPFHNIHFGVEIDRTAKPDRLNGHTPVIGFIGQIAPHKGTDLLIDAFLKLPNNTAVLKIYGPEDQDPIFMAKLKSLAKDSDIRFMGTFAKEKMAEIFKDIDLLVIPSRWYENSPLVLLNSLATHTPVLIADVAGMTEFLEPGINGHSFKRGNVNDLYENLFKLTKDKEKLFGLSKSTTYEKTPYMMAKNTLSIY